MILQ
ncbi:hypothetical protein CJF31_00011308 [Rutstroemia sp. NJR-2017a BVV2]|jgi:26S proteasome regulatory subunit N1